MMENGIQESEFSASCGINIDDSTPHASGDAANQAGSFYFPKPALTFQEQLDHMIENGLTVNDRTCALTCLSDANYYRLRGYWLTLEDEDGRFLEDVSFDDIWSIYELDSELRLWLLKAISPIEIKMRTQFAYHLAHAIGALSYLDPSNFVNETNYEHSIGSFTRERDYAQRQNVPCVVHNMEKYGCLPIWAAVEVMSLGTLSQLYGNLDQDIASADGCGSVHQAIAKEFGTSAIYLKSWLHHLTSIRNITAHHERLYNRVMTVRPRLLKRDKRFASAKEFPTFLVLKNIFAKSWPDRWNSLELELESIIDAFPNVSLSPMGFPDNWKSILGSR